ncbi:hypothetical protein DFH27DRAFT_583401, partial [Peziza echinospora]
MTMNPWITLLLMMATMATRARVRRFKRTMWRGSKLMLMPIPIPIQMSMPTMHLGSSRSHFTSCCQHAHPQPRSTQHCNPTWPHQLHSISSPSRTASARVSRTWRSGGPSTLQKPCFPGGKRPSGGFQQIPDHRQMQH